MDAAWLAVRLASLQQSAEHLPGHQPVSGAAADAETPQQAIGAQDTDRQRAVDAEAVGNAPGDTPAAAPSTLRRESGPQAAVRLPVAAALPQARQLARSLRPLRRRVPSTAKDLVIDVERTVKRASEEGIWLPVFRPRAERWLDVAIVVDRSLSMMLWSDAVAEVRRLLAWSGAFRSIATWWMQTDTEAPLIFRRQRDVGDVTTARNPGRLTPVARRGLVLVVTDCVSPRWYDGSVTGQLREWSRGSLVAIAQVLPQPFWSRTALSEATAVQLRTGGEGISNTLLRWTADFAWLPESTDEDPIGAPSTFVAPVVPLEPAAIFQFSRLVAGRGTDTIPGAFFDLESMRLTGRAPLRRAINPRERVARFHSVSSAAARRLAAALAASPVLTLRILRLLRQELLPDGRRSHEAEVLLSGLLRVRGGQPRADAEDVALEFDEGVRPLLLDSVTTGDAIRVLRHAAEQASSTLPEAQTFLTALDRPSESAGALRADSDFMRLAFEVLGRVGGAYSRVAIAGPPANADADGAVETRSDTAAQGGAPDIDRADLPPVPPPVPPQVGHYARRVDPFINRVGELEELRRWWADRDDRTPMYVTGPAGIGKTALLKQFISELLATAPPEGGVLALSDPAWETLPGIYEYFFGRPRRENAPPRELLAKMATSRDRRPRLLVLDGGEISGRQGQSFLSEFTSHFASSGAGKLLVVPSYGGAYGARVVELGPLRVEDVGDWLRRAGLPEDAAHSIIAEAESDPALVAQRAQRFAAEGHPPGSADEQLWAIVRNRTLNTEERVERLESLARAYPSDPLFLAQVRLQVVRCFVEAGRHPEAEAGVREARSMLERLPEDQPTATLWQQLGTEHFGMDDTWGAEEAFQRALSAFERLHLEFQTATVLYQLGLVAGRRKEFDRVLEINRRAAEILERSEERQAAAMLVQVYGHAAEAFTELERHREAFEFRQQQIGAAQRTEDAMAIANAMTEAGRAARRAGDDAAYRELVGAAITRWMDAGHEDIAQRLEEEIRTDARRNIPDTRFRTMQSLHPGPTLRAHRVRYDDAIERHGEWIYSRGSHDLSLPAEFRVAPFLVTNDAFRVFVQQGGYDDPRWWTNSVAGRELFRRRGGLRAGPAEWTEGPGFPEGHASHPVTGVSYREAVAFVRWLNVTVPAEDAWMWKLPTEDMWEFAARGERGFQYPWGNDFHNQACNSLELGIGTTSPVGTFPAGVSPSQGFDFAGNVWEFVEALDVPDHFCVLRGGSFVNNKDLVKSTLRLTGVPRDHRPHDFGFRLAQVRRTSEVA